MPTRGFFGRHRLHGRALAAKPYPLDTCPTGAESPAGATTPDAIAGRGLSEPDAAWHQAVDAANDLAMRAVLLRLEAANLHDEDRQRLLNTLILSTALSHKP